ITAIKIRLGLVIGFGALFGILNLIWWAVFGLVPNGESTPKSSLLFIVPAYAIDYSCIESEIPEKEDFPEDAAEAKDTEQEAEIAEIVANSIILRIGSPKALVGGSLCHIDEENKYLSPFIDENDRTLVPVRFIAETLGFGVEFDFETDSKKIMIGGDTDDMMTEARNLPLVMYIGENILEAGELFIEMDTAPVLTFEGRTFIPARPFAESLSINVFYAESERVIIITDLDIGDAEPAAKKAAESLPVWPIDMLKVLKEWKNWPANPDGTYHAGADFAIAEGSGVYAAHSGAVEDVLDLGNISYGKYIIVKSVIGGKARYIYYGHLSEQSVKKGDNVRAGDIIGKTGNTGNSTGPHLHFEVRDENKTHGSAANPSLDPYDYLP
ncbi:MAG: peptidoglycan DD-metalloendopeptidase family protein, partial [Oscillospiraceae bacterium]|nr:peptidoglycan DD-metalloendopeptidase family protein [Oscillospiraceae bacterium]